MPRLGLERLASRVLPSVSPLGVTAHAAAPLPGMVPLHLPLTGRGHGSYSYDSVQSGAGIEYRLSGTATLSGMGRVSVSGSVHSVGFIQKGQAGGELTFTDKRGTVTVELIGQTQTAFSPLPGSFHYRVVSETGAFAGHHWPAGTLTLTLSQPQPGGTADPHGGFALALNPGAPHPNRNGGVTV